MDNTSKWWPKWCVRHTNMYIYSSHFLSSWGDHMWIFGSGLLLVEILPESLQLTAIYGLSVGVAVLLFGALIGDWVDRTGRLRAVQTALILQKTFIVLSVTAVCGYLWHRDSTEEPMVGWKRNLCYGFIILFAVLGNLAQVARVITIERDWVVEICGGNSDMLASMTATLRRIDLGTMVLAPIVTGQIMTHVGLKIAGVFIGVWNALSVFFGYYLMWKVYQTVPSLRKDKKLWKDKGLGSSILHEDSHIKLSDVTGYAKVNFKEPLVPENVTALDDPAKPPLAERENDVDDGDTSCMSRMLYSFIVLYRGMQTYKKYDVFRAGLSLAFLYLTVLGFDGITVGYIYTQGVSESTLGLLMGGAALNGVFGTMAYPVIRRRIGIVRTGLFALGAQWIFLTLCVLSILLPGSPFDPYYWSRSPTDLTDIVNCTYINASVADVVPLGAGLFNVTADGAGGACQGMASTPMSIISICVFMTGIIGNRFGVWMADLTITQLFLETVEESERGVVNGVQTSINMLMDMLKFALVVALPRPPLFGFLAIISFCSVTTADILYASYSRKARGHLFHFADCGTPGQKTRTQENNLKA
ncbi:solute carrier family 40 member 1-like [Haliotis rufescens]|uniref:solute carrier family 40 member 1-like n=1 Tax=Haliotis rufescens TaxID=6454 RepID=UPI001EB031E6|nr:solute carrier family 40 member 1-like [Haliotis rufescens]